MFNNPFLQSAADSRNRRQQLDHLLRITAPHERIVLGTIGLVLVAVLAWALFGSVVRSVTVDGILIEQGVRHDVVATEPGYLREFLVAPGDRVEAGSPIARQTVPELVRETAALRDRVERLETEAGPAGGALAAARVALAQIEARRSASELILSQMKGEVTALRSAPGDYLPAGAAVAQLRDSHHRPLQAVLRVAPDIAERIRPGMQASVEVALPDGTNRRLTGEVGSVTAGPLPGWLLSLPPAAAPSTSRVNVALHPGSGLALPEGTVCRVRILLGRHSPAALFGS